MSITPALAKAITQVACKLHRERGIPYKQACRMAMCAAWKVSGRMKASGMGQVEPETIQKAISPWLWVFSVAGFAMTVLNTSRVSRRLKRLPEMGRRRRSA